MAEKINTQQQADTIVKYLESICDKSRGIDHIAATEVKLKYKIAIIRGKNFSIDLVNPRIIKKKNMIISLAEPCSSSFCLYNCLRYKSITIENGIKQTPIKIYGKNAIKVQHLIDHLNSVPISKRFVRLGLVREGGKILSTDMCPCGSKKRFNDCCGDDSIQILSDNQKKIKD